MRAFICELTDSCSETPRDSYYDDSATKLSDLATQLLAFINKPQVFGSAKNVLDFGKHFIEKRKLASQIIGNLFKNYMTNLSNFFFEFIEYRGNKVERCAY